MLIAEMTMSKAKNILARPSSIRKMPALNRRPRTRRASNRSSVFREAGASRRLPAFNTSSDLYLQPVSYIPDVPAHVFSLVCLSARPAKPNVYEQEHEDIVLAALQVAAETLAFDDGAKGRLSIRQRKLEQAIESRERARKERIRERQQRPPPTPEESKAALERALAMAERLKRPARKPKKPPE
jgi:hypothetical protein